MLSPHDRQILAELERRLTADDPAFAARMRAPYRRRPSPSLLLCCLVGWLLLPVLAAVGGWVLVLPALVAFAAVLLATRVGRHPVGH